MERFLESDKQNKERRKKYMGGTSENRRWEDAPKLEESPGEGINARDGCLSLSSGETSKA